MTLVGCKLQKLLPRLRLTPVVSLLRRQTAVALRQLSRVLFLTALLLQISKERRRRPKPLLPRAPWQTPWLHDRKGWKHRLLFQPHTNRLREKQAISQHKRLLQYNRQAQVLRPPRLPRLLHLYLPQKLRRRRLLGQSRPRPQSAERWPTQLQQPRELVSLGLKWPAPEHGSSADCCWSVFFCWLGCSCRASVADTHLMFPIAGKRSLFSRRPALNLLLRRQKRVLRRATAFLAARGRFLRG